MIYKVINGRDTFSLSSMSLRKHTSHSTQDVVQHIEHTVSSPPCRLVLSTGEEVLVQHSVSHAERGRSVRK